MTDPLGAPIDDPERDRLFLSARGDRRDDVEEDPLWFYLDALEAGIKGMTVPPPPPSWPDPGPLDMAPELFEPPIRDFPSQGPPPPSEPGKVSFISIDPPAAARPYFTPAGLQAPSYHPLGGSGAGVRGGETTESSPIRWCPEADQPVSEDTCRACGYWGDQDGSGTGYCCYGAKDDNTRDDDGQSDEH